MLNVKSILTNVKRQNIFSKNHSFYVFTQKKTRNKHNPSTTVFASPRNFHLRIFEIYHKFFVSLRMVTFFLSKDAC